MDQNLDKKIEFREKLINLYNNNRLKIYFLLLSLLTGIIVTFSLNHYYVKINNLISNKYTQAVLYVSKKDYKNANQIFDEIIVSKNKFYSILAINTILEKDLIEDKNKILKYFDILEKNKFSQENQDLILLKKALYLIKINDQKNGNFLLKKLIDKNCNIKSLAQEIIEK